MSHRLNNLGFRLVMKIHDEKECDDTAFDFPEKNSSDDFTIVKNPRPTPRVLNGEEYFHLTDSKLFQVGAVWYDKRVPVKKGFTTHFSFRFSDGKNGHFDDGSLPGADGIAFVVQNYGSSPVGEAGGGIGYAGIPNSIAVEFDTYNNYITLDSIFDDNGNHIAVQSMGKDPNSANHLSSANLGITSNIPIIRSDSTIYYAQIDYNIEPGQMRIFLDTTGEFAVPVLVLDADLERLLDLEGNQWAYVGITSATGHAYENHDILSWYMCPKPASSGADIFENADNLLESPIGIYPNPVGNKVKKNIFG